MDFLLIAMPVIVVGFTVLFIYLPRYGPHYTSKLNCPKCKRFFFFHWVPGATLVSLRYGNHRKLRCPYCKTMSRYDIVHTRVSKPRKAKANA